MKHIGEKKRLFILLFLLFIACLACFLVPEKKVLKITPGMFGSDSPTINAKIKVIFKNTVYLPYLERTLLIKASHPLARYITLYKIVTPEKKTYWVCPETRVKKDAAGKIHVMILPQKLSWRYWLLAFSILMLVIPTTQYIYKRGKNVQYKDLLNISIILGICWGSLTLLLIYSDNIITSAADDYGYFKTAVDMAKFDFKGPWTFTIGLGLWYIPFILYYKAANFYDIALPFANFCGFVVMPATMILIYFIIKKLCSSRLKALISVLMLALFPFFYHYIQIWDKHYFRSFFALPSISFNNPFYNTILIRGYNCMSDTPSNFLIMLCVFLILYLPAKKRYAALVAFIYGVSCLVRINNIFFAPLLAWLFWNNFTEKNIDFKYLFKAALIALTSFTIAFIPQLIINHLHFDSIFTFPYILHNNEAARGFRWVILDTGIKFMGRANFAIWATGLTGMLFIADRKLRNTLILWGIPVILFFFGYPCIGCDARRFILSSFGAMFAAFTTVEIWEQLNTKQKTLTFLTFGTGILLVTPSGYFYPGPLPLDLDYFTWGAKFVLVMSIIMPLATIALAWNLRKQVRPALFIICFGLLYYCGSAYLLASVMVLLLAWALYDWGWEVYLKAISSCGKK